MSREGKLKLIFRSNMVFGFLVTAISTYMILTGHYANLQQRVGSESLMNTLAIGGILYMVGFWYMCVFRKFIFKFKPQ